MSVTARDRIGRSGRPAVVFLFAALLATAVVVSVTVRVHNGNWTGMFLVGDEFGARAPWPIPVVVHDESIGYDGQFFLALALDPFLRTPLTHVLDDPTYRARRISWSFAAWSISLGNPRATPLALILLLLASVAALGWLVAREAALSGASAWWGAVTALGLGSIVCQQRMLGDLIMVTLLLAVAARVRDRPGTLDIPAVLLFSLAVLQKETAILAAPLLLIPALRRPGFRHWALIALSFLPVLAWWRYVDLVSGVSRPYSPAITFSAPGVGLIAASEQFLLRESDIVRLAKDLGFLGIHVVAIVLGLWVGVVQLGRLLRGRRLRPLAVAIGLFAVLGLMLSEHVWAEPWAYSRVLLPLLALETLLAVRVTRSRGSATVRSVALAVASASACAGVLFVIRNVIERAP